MSTITLDIADRIATITLNRPKTLNALTKDGKYLAAAYGGLVVLTGLNIDYDFLANTLRKVDKEEEVLVTVIQGERSSKFKFIE